MPNRTVKQITDAAWRQNGIESPKSADDTAAWLALQDMLDSWSLDTLVVPYYITEEFTLTIGKAVYSIGLAADSPELVSSTGRPLSLASAFVREASVDYPVEVNMTSTEYNDIQSKERAGRPLRIFYDPQYPNGSLKFDYEPTVAYTFSLTSEKPLSEVAIDGTLSLPQGVNEALYSNLGIRLAPGKNNKIQPETAAFAASSLSRLRKHNASHKQKKVMGHDLSLLYRPIR